MKHQERDYTAYELITLLDCLNQNLSLYVNGGEWQNNPMLEQINGRIFLRFTDDKSCRIQTVGTMIEYLKSIADSEIIYVPIVDEEIADSHNWEECQFKPMTTIEVYPGYVVLK